MKTYTKPEILFEDFSLSTNIAGGCEHTTSNHYRNSCGFELIPGQTLFISEPVCSFPVEDGYNGICYHVPNQENNVFSS